MRTVEIEWHPLGIKVVAILTEGANRNLADLLWDSLPYNSLQNHALVSGNHLYHLVPTIELLYTQAERKEDRTKSPDGTLFLSQLQHLAIKYGPLSEYIPAAPIGMVIPEHIPLLREAGRACWNATYRTKQIIEARVRRYGTTELGFRLPRPIVETQLHPDVQSLLQRIHDETQRVWIRPPHELFDLHRGLIPSGAGSYDQFFSTMVFVNGETRPLGYCALNGLVRLGMSPNLTIEVLREITPNFVKTPSEFLGYCGLDTLWGFAQELFKVLPLVANKQEYVALIGALALYANVLNTWNLQYFPWRHGVEHPAGIVQEPVRLAT